MTKKQLQELVLKQQNKIQVITEEMSGFSSKIDLLKRKVQEKEKQVQVITKEKESLLKKLQEMLEKFSSMKFELSQLKRLIFGSKRERFVSGAENGQMSLPFNVEEATREDSVATTEKVSSFQRQKRKNHPGRLTLPDHLPVEEIIIEPEEDVTGLKCIGYETTDELEYQQAILKIKRFKRPKYARKDNEG